MKPVLIAQHLSADGPAFLGSWLCAQGVAFEVRNAEAGENLPDDLRGHSALAILGGEMSANDALPPLRRAEALILQAIDRGVPVLGHCLGGQLVARALGARVAAAAVPEIGWQTIDVQAGPAASRWFGDAGPRTVFQWHFDAFDLPSGAERLAGSSACPNQAFCIGPHLALQFHVELDAEKLERWSRENGARYLAALEIHHTSVQDGNVMRERAPEHLLSQQALADRLYRRWLEGRIG